VSPDSRRRFLRGVAATPIALLAAPAFASPRLARSGAFNAWFGLPTLMLENLSKSSFRPHVGSDFRLIAPDGNRVPAVLREVNDAPGEQAAAEESFSLVFEAPAGAPQVQQTYTVEQEGVGQFALFLVPTHATDEGVEYEAVFNRTKR
jgi:hypothetical protein